MPSDPGILTLVLNAFLAVFTAGFPRLLSDAWAVWQYLAVLEVIFVAMACIFARDADVIAEIVWTSLRLGFFVLVISQFPSLCQAVVDSLMLAGLRAGGSTVSLREFTDPSKIAYLGFVAVEPILTHLKAYGFVSGMANLPDVIISGIAALLILFTFFIIAIQLLVAFVEFYLFAALAVILVPWGVFRYTAFVAEKAFGLVIAHGIRLMVLAFVTSASFPILIRLSLPADPTWNQQLSLFCGVLAVAILSWHAPAVAGGMLAGVPSLTAGMAAQTVMAGALATTGTGRQMGGTMRGVADTIRAGARWARRRRP